MDHTLWNHLQRAADLIQDVHDALPTEAEHTKEWLTKLSTALDHLYRAQDRIDGSPEAEGPEDEEQS